MRKLLALTVIVLQVCSNISFDVHNDKQGREKRQLTMIPLVYPYGSNMRLIMGFAMPVPVDRGMNLLFSVAFLYQYAQFMNITELSQYYSYNTVSRSMRSSDWGGRNQERMSFYQAVEGLLDTKGFNGSECVLRCICEASQHTLREEGLFGEIVHILLTPNYGNVLFKEDEEENELTPYMNAYTAGRQMFSCPDLYTGCPEGRGILEMITTLQED